MNNKILKIAILNSIGTAVYIACVAAFLTYVPKALGAEEGKTILIPIAMLMLLVFSATFTGLLVLGRPIMWYLDGKKKEAVSLLLTTVATMFVMTLVAFAAVALYKG